MCSTKLTTLDANALANLLEVGSDRIGLKYIYLHIQMENQEDYEHNCIKKVK